MPGEYKYASAMIYEKNIVTMRKLGLAGWEKLFSGPTDIDINAQMARLR